MAKIDELTFSVNVKLSVSDDTVETCLRLIEMWLNEDVTRSIRGGVRNDDGRVDPLRICKSNVPKEE